VGFPLAGLALAATAYWLVYWGWALLIRKERKHRLKRNSER
jgi:uncharacterized protein